MRGAACLACRRRKSRCKVESNAVAACLMCRSHGTTCEFPQGRRQGRRQRHRIVSRPSEQVDPHSRSPGSSTAPTHPQPEQPAASIHEVSAPALAPAASAADALQDLLGDRTATSPLAVNEIVQGSQTLDSPLDSGNNRRILGPVLDSDSRVLADYFPRSLGDHRVMKTFASTNARNLSAPAVFLGARRRPAGLNTVSNLAKANLDLIEKFLDPFIPSLIEM